MQSMGRGGDHLGVAARRIEALNLPLSVSLTVCLGIGLAVGVAYATGVVFGGIDARMLWDADLSYPIAWTSNAYVYPPPLAQLVGLAHPIGYPIFVAALEIGLFWALWYCAREWSLPLVAGWVLGWALGWTLPAAVGSAVLLGNVQLLVAAAVVAGFRWPALYAFGILTKVGPVVGLTWFVARREWHNLAVACGATATIAAISFVADPTSWVDWVGFIRQNNSVSPLPVVPVPFLIRIAMSTALIAWGARTDRRWTVPIGVGWALPALYEGWYLSIWVGAIALRRSAARPGAAPGRRVQEAGANS